MPEIILSILGIVLSVFLGILLSSNAAIVSILITIFMEIVLITLRVQIKELVDTHIKNQLVNMASLFESLGIIQNANDLSKIMLSSGNITAINLEIERFKGAIKDLNQGKRRLYKQHDLYEEQTSIIKNTKKSIHAIHIVKELIDLQRWDPDKFNRTSSFYTKLYQSFLEISSKKSIKERKRIVILPDKSILDMQNKYNVIPKHKVDELKKSDDDILDEDDKNIKNIIDTVESIHRIVIDQKDQLKFEVRFITANEALNVGLGVAISDSIISDIKKSFEFSNDNIMNIRAYVIESKEYIDNHEKAFKMLWNSAYNFKLEEKKEE